MKSCLSGFQFLFLLNEDVKINCKVLIFLNTPTTGKSFVLWVFKDKLKNDLSFRYMNGAIVFPGCCLCCKDRLGKKQLRR